MTLTNFNFNMTRRSILLATAAACATGLGKTAFGQGPPEATDPLTKAAAEAYVYFYPLVVFGVSMEVLTNVEKPTWERLSAPVNQFMSVRQSDPTKPWGNST
jgi:hypothetical protein